MVTAESLCCGTPVVGFKAGAPEQIAIPEYSRFVEFGNLNELKEAIIDFLKINRYIDVNRTTGKYSSATMCEEYLKLYNNLSI